MTAEFKMKLKKLSCDILKIGLPRQGVSNEFNNQFDFSEFGK